MADPATEPATVYPSRARARLALSAACRELSDRARSQVPTLSDGRAHPGEYVEAARALVALAGECLERAVVYERERGTTWEAIGETLGITRQSAHERFAAAEDAWRDTLVRPWVVAGSVLNPRLPEGADDPDHAVVYLDAWARRHAEETDPNHDHPNPVSGGLRITPREVVLSEMQLVVDQALELARRRAYSGRDAVHPNELRQFRERRARLLAYLEQVDPDLEGIGQAAADARAQLEQLPEPAAKED